MSLSLYPIIGVAVAVPGRRRRRHVSRVCHGSVQTYWLRPELRRLSRGRSLGRVTAGVLTNTILPLSFDAAAVSP